MCSERKHCTRNPFLTPCKFFLFSLRRFLKGSENFEVKSLNVVCALTIMVLYTHHRHKTTEIQLELQHTGPNWFICKTHQLSKMCFFFHSFSFLNRTPWTSPYVTPVITHLVISPLLFYTQSSPHESIQQTTDNRLTLPVRNSGLF